MANILEFLRGVVTDADAQQSLRADGRAYVERSGFADLTGEDVVEAIRVLRRSLPADVADRLAPFDDEAALPPVRPGGDESELDAALRQLDFAVQCAPAEGASPDAAATFPEPAVAPAPPPTSPAFAVAEAPEPEPEPADEPWPTPVGASSAPADDGFDSLRSALGADQAPEPEPEPVAAFEPEPEPEPEPAPAPAFAAGPAPDVVIQENTVDHVPEPQSEAPRGGLDVSTLPSTVAFEEYLAEVAAEAKRRFTEVLDHADAEARAVAVDTRAQLEQVLEQAAEDAERIRGEAQDLRDEAERLRNDAAADRADAAADLERARSEADSILDSARREADDTRRLAEEELGTARRKAETIRADMDRRRNELRDAERQLRERLAGIDTLFRTALSDEP